MATTSRTLMISSARVTTEFGGGRTSSTRWPSVVSCRALVSRTRMIVESMKSQQLRSRRTAPRSGASATRTASHVARSCSPCSETIALYPCASSSTSTRGRSRSTRAAERGVASDTRHLPTGDWAAWLPSREACCAAASCVEAERQSHPERRLDRNGTIFQGRSVSKRDDPLAMSRIASRARTSRWRCRLRRRCR